MFNLIGMMRYHLILPVMKRTAVHETSEESVRKDKERATVCGLHMENYSLFGGCLSISSPMGLL